MSRSTVIAGVFHSLALRHKLVLTGFVWFLLLYWLFAALESAVANYKVFDTTGGQLRNQSGVLANAEIAASNLQSALLTLDSGKTYSASQLAGKIDAIARAANLSFDLNPQGDESTDLFSFHTVRITIRRAQLSDLLLFERELMKESPYLALSSFQINALKRDPRNLDASLDITSFELKSGALD